MAVTPGAAPVPVVVARGLGSHRALARLWADPGVEVVTSPRHATILVVAGAVPVDHASALRHVHDQVPAPRGVAAIDVTGDLRPLGLGEITHLPDEGAPSGALRALQDAVLAGDATSPAIGPATNPVDWQGVGPHGQGGEGMMGGTPYGRSMAMPPVEGRDGLVLDRLSLRLGPFLPGLPPGVAIDVGLQGDVLEEATLRSADLDAGTVGRPTRGDDLATRLLAALVELCAMAGLDALARRAARVALDPSHEAVADLRRRLDRWWGLRLATDGVGEVADGTDATGRWRRWLDRTGALTEATASAHAWPPVDPATIADALVGMELGRARLTLATLVPDLERLATSARAT